jgi:hypothetical protein
MSSAERPQEADMIRCSPVILLLATLTIGCSSSRPAAIYADPSFEGKKLRDGTVAFLLSDEIDVHYVVPELLVAFEGKPASAIAYLKRSLTDYLTGEERLPPGPGKYIGERLHLLDLRAMADSSLINRLVSLGVGETGEASFEVPQPAALASHLAGGKIDYLVVFQGMVLSKGTAVEAGYTWERANLIAQVRIWERESESLVWHGFVRGESILRFEDLSRGLLGILAGDLVRDFSKILFM